MRRTWELLAASVVVSMLNQSALTAQAPTPPKPTEAHQRLAYFVGKWTNEGEMKPGPMGPGGKITSVDTCEWFEGRFAIVCRYDGKGPMGPSKGMGIISYSPDAKAYTYYAIDNSGMARTTVPRGTVQGDTWTYHDESEMGGMKIKSRVTLKELSPSAYTFLMEFMGPDGKWAPLIESKLTKGK